MQPLALRVCVCVIYKPTRVCLHLLVLGFVAFQGLRSVAETTLTNVKHARL